MLGFIKNAGFETEAEIFAKPRADIAFALRLKKIVKYAHLRFVVGSGANFLRNRESELAIAGIGVAEGRKCRHHRSDDCGFYRLTLGVTDCVRPRLCDRSFDTFCDLEPRLTTIPPWDARFERQPGKTDTTSLPALRTNRCAAVFGA